MSWIKENAWALIIALLTITSTYTLYGYRITSLEKRSDTIEQEIATLTSGNVTTQIALAQIQTKLEYITLQINKLVQ